MKKKYMFLIFGLLIFPIATFFDYIYIARYSLIEYISLNLIEMLIFFCGVLCGENWVQDK